MVYAPSPQTLGCPHICDALASSRYGACEFFARIACCDQALRALLLLLGELFLCAWRARVGAEQLS